MEDSIKTVIVTGPTGAVGTALINELVDNGIRVYAVCRAGSLRRGAIPVRDGVSIVDCNLSDYEGLPSFIGEECDAFFHLAWDGTFGATRQDWILQESNVRYSLDAVRAASRMGCKVFVGVGSQSECGHVEGILHPDMPCNPDNGYGAAKLATRDMAKAYCEHLGMRFEWCRIVSLYGPNDQDKSLVMSVINTLLAGKSPKCTPCDQIWDYIYSKDAARAFRLVAEHGVDGSTYLIASGQSRPLREFVCDMRDVVSPGAEIGFGQIPYYPNQVMHLEADISNLVQDTGFEPCYTFKQGIEEIVSSLRAS